MNEVTKTKKKRKVKPADVEELQAYYTIVYDLPSENRIGLQVTKETTKPDKKKIEGFRRFLCMTRLGFSRDLDLYGSRVTNSVFVIPQENKNAMTRLVRNIKRAYTDKATKIERDRFPSRS